MYLLTANTGKTLFRVANSKERAHQRELDAAVREAGTSSMLVGLQKALWTTVESASPAAASRCMSGKKQ